MANVLCKSVYRSFLVEHIKLINIERKGDKDRADNKVKDKGFCAQVPVLCGSVVKQGFSHEARVILLKITEKGSICPLKSSTLHTDHCSVVSMVFNMLTF